MLLFHGFTASPKQFDLLARLLHERGYNVLVPRLPRHGSEDRLTTELALLTAGELKTAAVESVRIAQGMGARVTVAGFSMGGLLSSWVAQEYPVERVVSIAPFLGVLGLPHLFAGLAARWTLRFPNRFVWWDPVKKEQQLPAHGYPRYATHALAEAYHIAIDLFAAAKHRPPAAARILVVTNARETTVSNRSVARLLKLWRARKPEAIETHVFEDLPMSHDIIEPLRNPELVERVYPTLVRLIDR